MSMSSIENNKNKKFLYDLCWGCLEVRKIGH